VERRKQKEVIFREVSRDGGERKSITLEGGI
jgi:hypothetical protein